jgi:hypothetical protein
VAPTTMTTTTAVAWANNFVQKRHDEIGKCTIWHLIEFFSSISFCSSHRRLLEQCLIMCYE